MTKTMIVLRKANRYSYRGRTFTRGTPEEVTVAERNYLVRTTQFTDYVDGSHDTSGFVSMKDTGAKSLETVREPATDANDMLDTGVEFVEEEDSPVEQELRDDPEKPAGGMKIMTVGGKKKSAEPSVTV